MLIAFWQYRHWCADPSYTACDYCYDVRDPLEMALIAGAAAGGLVGFLWWNTSPARIFMGDTGAMALGGLIAGLAMATRTILLLPLIGLLFVIIAVTWIIQIVSFRTTGKRVFRMVAAAAPLRAGRLERGQHRGPVLDHRRHRHGRLARPVLPRTSCG